MLGLYIHIPFCERKCPYCDFYSLPINDAAADDYTAAVCRAVKSAVASLPIYSAQTPASKLFGDGRISADTIYFGGGTPTVFGAHRILRILSCICKFFDIAKNAEITIETNPASCSSADLQILRRAGVNRISFGVQSLVDSQLSALGRLHTADEARRAIEDAHNAGFTNISADLMLGIPGQNT